MIREIVEPSSRELLNDNLGRLDLILSDNGLIPISSAPESYGKFATLNPEHQQKIIRNISLYLEVLSEEVSPEVIKFPREVEIARLKKALNAFGLEPMDKKVFDYIGDDDLIEVYGPEFTQLYRNLLFCKLCSYSLLDLAVNPWDELYEKPARVTQQISDLVMKIMTTAEGTLAYNIDSFVQREKFIYAKTLRTYIVEPRYISPLINSETGKREGVLSTYGARILAEGSDSLKFDII